MLLGIIFSSLGTSFCLVYEERIYMWRIEDWGDEDISVTLSLVDERSTEAYMNQDGTGGYSLELSLPIINYCWVAPNKIILATEIQNIIMVNIHNIMLLFQEMKAINKSIFKEVVFEVFSVYSRSCF